MLTEAVGVPLGLQAPSAQRQLARREVGQSWSAIDNPHSFWHAASSLLRRLFENVGFDRAALFGPVYEIIHCRRQWHFLDGYDRT